MYIKYISKKHKLLIVYCNKKELYDYVFPYLDNKIIEILKNDDDFFVSDRFAEINPGLLEPKIYTVVITGDCEISVQQPAFPFSGMWNDQNDFKLMNNLYSNIDEILKEVRNGNAFGIDG